MNVSRALFSSVLSCQAPSAACKEGSWSSPTGWYGDGTRTTARGGQVPRVPGRRPYLGLAAVDLWCDGVWCVPTVACARRCAGSLVHEGGEDRGGSRALRAERDHASTYDTNVQPCAPVGVVRGRGDGEIITRARCRGAGGRRGLNLTTLLQCVRRLHYSTTTKPVSKGKSPEPRKSPF